MSYEMNHIGSRAFSHGPSSDAEQEYDRLRNLARKENDRRRDCSQRSQEAYRSGDGALAHTLSEEAKKHGANQDRYNKQASEYIFRENNSVDKVPGDTIDLHGQFVEEAEDILEERIRVAQSQGQSHLHVIVGKGNHSRDHVQKIKPRVEQVCRELGLNYQTEHNEGRIFVDLTGAPVHQMPPPPSGYGQGWGAPGHGGQGGYPGGQHGGQTSHGQQHYGGGGKPHGGQQQHHGGQQQNQNDDVEDAVKGIFKLFKGCGCEIM